jgi:hypothetical protein
LAAGAVPAGMVVSMMTFLGLFLELIAQALLSLPPQIKKGFKKGVLGDEIFFSWPCCSSSPDQGKGHSKQLLRGSAA